MAVGDIDSQVPWHCCTVTGGKTHNDMGTIGWANVIPSTDTSCAWHGEGAVVVEVVVVEVVGVEVVGVDVVTLVVVGASVDVVVRHSSFSYLTISYPSSSSFRSHWLQERHGEFTHGNSLFLCDQKTVSSVSSTITEITVRKFLVHISILHNYITLKEWSSAPNGLIQLEFSKRTWQ